MIGRADRDQAIVEAAVVRFVRQGYGRTTMDELAADLGVGKGTLYLSYPGKAAIFDAVLADVQSWMIGRARAAGAGPPGPDRDAGVLQALYGDVHAAVSQGAPPWLDEGPPAEALNRDRLRTLAACLAPLAAGAADAIDAAARGLRRGLDGQPSPTSTYRASLNALATLIDRLR